MYYLFQSFKHTLKSRIWQSTFFKSDSLISNSVVENITISSKTDILIQQSFLTLDFLLRFVINFEFIFETNNNVNNAFTIVILNIYIQYKYW